jgi:hypothetical protein
MIHNTTKCLLLSMLVGGLSIGVATTPARGATIGIRGDAIPDLVIDLASGTATLTTDGAGGLSAFQIQSRGANATVAPAGDGDGCLLPGKPSLGNFVFNNSSRDEHAGSFGTLPVGDFALGQLFDVSLLPAGVPLTSAFVLSDLRFGYNGDGSAAGNGTVVFVPEPISLAVVTCAVGFMCCNRTGRTRGRAPGLVA